MGADQQRLQHAVAGDQVAQRLQSGGKVLLGAAVETRLVVDVSHGQGGASSGGGHARSACDGFGRARSVRAGR
jgi:hypothetical protein